MTDLSSFSKNDFRATQWINSLVDEVPDGESLENFLSSISLKLHIAAQDYSEQLETAMVESMSAMPRMVSEIARLEDQLHAVQNEMRSISDHIHSVDKKSVAGIEELSRLDHLKSNMEKCKSTLGEHARWNQIVREAKQLLEGGGILSETADRIEIMFKSLHVLKNLPGHEERLETCDTFRLTLLNALRPNIRKEITEMSVASLQEYLYVFRKLNSDSEFEKEYVNSRPQSIRNVWDNYQYQSKEGFSQWLASFLGTIVKFMNDEESNIAELFGGEYLHRIENLMLVETLAPMKRGLSDRLQRIDNANVAFECFTVSDEFSKRILSFTEGSNRSDKIAVLETVFGAFAKYMPSYLDCEERQLKNQLSIALEQASFRDVTDMDMLDADNDPIEQLSAFSEKFTQSADIFAKHCTDALLRSLRILGGSQIKQMVRIVVLALQNFTKLFTLKMAHFAVALGLQPENAALSAADAGNTGLLASASEPYPNYNEESKIVLKMASYILSSEGDRQALSPCVLKVLQAVGCYTRTLGQVEGKIRSVCAEILKVIAAVGNFPEDVDTTLKKGYSMGALYGAYAVMQDENHIAELKSFLVANSATYSQGVFSAVTVSLKKLIVKAGETMLLLSTGMPSKLISTYASEEGWSKDVGHGDFEDMKQNLLPQSTVTQVGEHMLSWVQDLESFASSDALADLLVLKGESSQLGPNSTGWQQVKEKLEMVDDKAIEQICSRTSVHKLLLAFERELLQASQSHGIQLAVVMEAIHAKTADPDISPLDADVMDSTAEGGQVLVFVNEWLTAIADAIFGLFLAQILQIRSLTPLGSAQLLVDVDYLSNVINAMGIKPHPLLHFLKLLLRENVSDLQQTVHNLNIGKPLGALKDLLKVTSAISKVLMK